MNAGEDKILTENERFRQIARILAGGVLRLRARAALPTAATQRNGPQILSESGVNGLEVPPETVLTVHAG
jgi:hypothetical protein